MRMSLGALHKILACSILWLVAADLASAQSFTAGVRDAVRESDNVVPGVTVLLINEASGATRETVSNAVGEYDFSAVAPGTYTVRASLVGFKTYERHGVRIATQQFVTVDVVLGIGDLQETITVSAVTPLVDTANASIGTVLDAKDLNGLRRARRANNYVIDGVAHTDLVNRPSVNPSFEAVESVNVQLHTYDAETGRTGGGTYNVTARSGGNSYRGSAFYQLRPSSLVANNFFSQAAGQPKANSYFHNSGWGRRGPAAVESNVLLVRDGGLQVIGLAQQHDSSADMARARRRFLAKLQRCWSAIDHFMSCARTPASCSWWGRRCY